MMDQTKLLCISGPTATGKTRLAAMVAAKMQGEIISADSRQVFRNMNLGTGKDYEDYLVNGQNIPYHLIDILEAGAEYNVFEFQKDFLSAYHEITGRGKLPVLCGGTAMYIESVLAAYRLSAAPRVEDFRFSLKDESMEELQMRLKSIKPLHNTTDLLDRERLIRAIEISRFETSTSAEVNFPKIPFLLVAIAFEREIIRRRITERLQQRLKNGMIEEVQQLLNKGLTPDQLKFYGLEYRFITMYLNHEIRYDEMYSLLNIAIHQFAKRQMTWFRRMEKQGFEIHWIDGQKTENEKVEAIIKLYQEA